MKINNAREFIESFPKRVWKSKLPRRLDRFAHGLCWCGKPLLEGKRVCQCCWDRLKINKEIARKFNRENNLCFCGNNLPPKRKVCWACRMQQTARRVFKGVETSPSVEKTLGVSFLLAKVILEFKAAIRYAVFPDPNTKYQVTYIYPLRLADCNDPDQRTILGHISNLQVLTAKENFARRDSVPWSSDDPFWNATPENCIMNLRR